MKFIKLSVISLAVLGTTTAMAAQPAYEYNTDQGIIRNTTGAVVNSSKTLIDTAIHPAAVSAEIGTLGYGANIAWGVNESTELQAGWSGLNVDGDVKLDADDSLIKWGDVLGEEYKGFKGTLDYNVKANNPYLGVQLRPLKNWLTVGTGIIVPNNEINARLTPTNGQTATVNIENTEYTIPTGTTVDIKAENKNALAPYATIGFRPNITNRWGAFVEAGAAYMGDYDSHVNVNGTVLSDEPAVVDATADFVRNAEREINDSNLKWYPIVKAGVTLRF